MKTFISSLVLAAMFATGAARGHETAVPVSAVASVSVAGAVQQPLSLSAEDLRQFASDQIVELRLPGRQADAPASVVKGVRLRAVLDRARLVIVDHNTVKKIAIIASASDGYQVVFSWSELFNADLGDAVLVLFERDGKPLSAGEGPLALISGKDIRTGPRHVKWLKSIDVRQIVGEAAQ